MKNFIILFLVMLSGIATGWFSHQYECDIGGVSVISDTVIKLDTVFYEKPTFAKEMAVSYVTRWLPIVGASPAAELPGTGVGADANAPATVAADAAGTVAADTAAMVAADTQGTGAGGLPYCNEVVIPITQKEYNSTDYRAWVSGYEASLDSIEVYRNTEIITIDKKRRRWGCVFGIGYGAALGGVTPYVGVMLGYRLL